MAWACGMRTPAKAVCILLLTLRMMMRVVKTLRVRHCASQPAPSPWKPCDCPLRYSCFCQPVCRITALDDSQLSRTDHRARERRRRSARTRGTPGCGERYRQRRAAPLSNAGRPQGRPHRRLDRSGIVTRFRSRSPSPSRAQRFTRNWQGRGRTAHFSRRNAPRMRSIATRAAPLSSPFNRTRNCSWPISTVTTSPPFST